MQIIKLNQVGRVINVQLLRVPKVASPDPASQTFYLSSEAEGLDKEYVIRTRPDRMKLGSEFICSCPDFTIRRWEKHEDCKHITIIRGFADRVGGVTALAGVVRSDDQF